MINPFKKTYTDEELKVFLFLDQLKLFRHLTNSEKSSFLPYMYLRKYKADEAVFFRNDPSHALYIIGKGEVLLTLDFKERFENIATLKSGKAFGMNALVDDTKRIYNAIITSEEAELYVIPQVNIHHIFAERLRIKSKMLNALAEVHNEYMENLFNAYKSSFGFFSLGQIPIIP